MTPAIRNIALFSSSDFEETYTFRRKSDKALLDFTSCTGVAEIRINPTDAAPVGSFTVTFPSPGVASVSMPRATILTMLGTNKEILAHWDLNIVSLAGKSIMYLRGACGIFTANSRVA